MLACWSSVALSPGCVGVQTGDTERVATAPSLHEIRVGVEFVAPEAASDGYDRALDASMTEDKQRPGTPAPRRLGDDADSRPTQSSERGLSLRPLSRRQIAALPTATERATFRMLHTLVGPDGDRLPRELGWSFLQQRLGAVDAAATDPWTDPVSADVEDALREVGPSLMRKPLRNALREFPLVRDVELWIEDFKIHNVPTSGAYLDSRDEDRRRYGHVSLRLQDNSSDRLSFTYSVQGWRVGASRETVRAGYSALLSDGLWFTVGSTYDHMHDRYDAMAELKFDVSARTRLLCTFGNQINLFPGPALERAARKDLDGGTGAMVYVETIF